MGMDVYGKSATDQTGEYFRNNVWWWHPLATYVTETFPELTAGCEYWHSNDGDGLDAAGSVALAEALDKALAAGDVARYAEERSAALEALPDEVCWLCEGTGSRTDEVGRAHGLDGPGGCNGCQGKGQVKPWAAAYQFDAENVAEFSRFLKSCGGFEIC